LSENRKLKIAPVLFWGWICSRTVRNPRWSGPWPTMFTTEDRTDVLTSATRKDCRNRISLNQSTERTDDFIYIPRMEYPARPGAPQRMGTGQ